MDFKRFDVVEDDSDHHFFETHVTGNCFSDTKNEVYRCIMKEWKSLEKDLPSGFIYVRAYERRIDLLRAVIVGAPGTPYHDGLFFFDIAIPNDYPKKPPQVHYHSFGFRLNPNLYANGKVCLSLLNTWMGKKDEMWNKENSNLLQVLLSIQALVLNEKPFFNEPANNALNRRWFDGASRAYNECAFIYTCRTSLNLIRKPPKNFEGFVSDHFRSRGLVILSACREYVNGRVKVGFYNYNGNTDAVSGSKKVKVKVLHSFYESLEGVYRQMYDAFVQCGASLDPLLKALVFELELKPVKSNRGILKKAMARIKMAFAFKKKKTTTTAVTNDSTESIDISA